MRSKPGSINSKTILTQLYFFNEGFNNIRDVGILLTGPSWISIYTDKTIRALHNEPFHLEVVVQKRVSS